MITKGLQAIFRLPRGAHLMLMMLSALCAAASMANAQSLGVRALITQPSGEDLITIAGVEVRAKPGPRPVVLSIGFQNGREVRPFVFCAGLVLPDTDCSPRKTESRVELRSVTLGYEAAQRRGPWHLAATPQVGAWWVRSEWDSQESDHSRTHWSASAFLGLSAALSRQLGAGLPLRLDLGAQATLALGTPEHCVDCFFASYEQGFSAGSVFAGLVYDFR